jgi:hypothetical protein
MKTRTARDGPFVLSAADQRRVKNEKAACQVAGEKAMPQCAVIPLV